MSGDSIDIMMDSIQDSIKTDRKPDPGLRMSWLTRAGLATVLPILSLIGPCGWLPKALAHGVAIEYQPTQAYRIQAAYDTGAPMVNAQVAIYAPDDPAKPWLTGTTDGQGQFMFSPSTPGNWEVQVRQAGHGDILVIPVSDSQAGAAGDTATDAAEDAAKDSAKDAAEDMRGTNAVTSSLNSYTPLQKGLMMGAVVWGCVGTALFFAKGKRLEHDAHS